MWLLQVGIELVSITLWRDSDAIAAAFGDRWARPTTMPGLDGLLDEPHRGAF
ncbi:MAG: hypothetical protein M3067_05075 [Chloroflexota bacterium]|nr:hypothetical protein [Chloroflexota bacterium]